MRSYAYRAALGVLPLIAMTGCTAIGSMMSPYPEKFGCKNKDHGVCVSPDRAYEDAVAGRPSRSDPAVTNDKKLLKHQPGMTAMPGPSTAKARPGTLQPSAFSNYRSSVYAKLQGLIEQPVTPMLKSPRTVRTLILPYADRERPERLYMPRYVFSVLDQTEWVVGDYLVEPVTRADAAPILGQVKDKSLDAEGGK